VGPRIGGYPTKASIALRIFSASLGHAATIWARSSRLLQTVLQTLESLVVTLSLVALAIGGWHICKAALEGANPLVSTRFETAGSLDLI